jgi:hypothetical protein
LIEQVREQSWRTPSSSDGEGGIMEMREGCAGKYKLRDHVAAWATPQLQDGHNIVQDSTSHKTIPAQLTEMKSNGKLNPRWVETLMGLPVGWVMPSCTSPVTTEQTNSDSSETESSLPPQNSHSELFGRN